MLVIFVIVCDLNICYSSESFNKMIIKSSIGIINLDKRDSIEN